MNGLSGLRGLWVCWAVSPPQRRVASIALLAPAASSDDRRVDDQSAVSGRGGPASALPARPVSKIWAARHTSCGARPHFTALHGTPPRPAAGRAGRQPRGFRHTCSTAAGSVTREKGGRAQECEGAHAGMRGARTCKARTGMRSTHVRSTHVRSTHVRSTHVRSTHVRSTRGSAKHTQECEAQKQARGGGGDRPHRVQEPLDGQMVRWSHAVPHEANEHGAPCRLRSQLRFHGGLFNGRSIWRRGRRGLGLWGVRGVWKKGVS